MFVNRQKELAALNRAYAEQSSQFIVIYGKRRVGKTELVKQFFRELPHIYYLADKASEKDQLRMLSEKVGLFFQDEFLLSRGFGDWYDCFKYLKTKGRLVLVIDEFPYLIEANRAIPSIFQKGWDEDLKDSGIFFILLGSSIGMMETEVLGYKSPLFGRRTGQLQVEPLTFDDARGLFPDASFPAFLPTYAVLGGTPAYLRQFDPQADFWDNIRTKILSPDAYLYREPDFILRAELREPRNYFAILRAISLGKTKAGEIINETGLEKNILGKYLSVLGELKIIRREVPVTETLPEKSKKGLHQMADPFFRFWFQFVYPNRSFIEEGQIDFVMERKIKPAFDRFISIAFEDVCRGLVRSSAWKGCRFERIGRWWSKDGEIDVVATNEAENTILCGEAKWSINKAGTDILENLKRKAALVPWGKAGRKEILVLFSRSGFTDDLKKRAREEGVILWEPEESSTP
jgi:AAA+ ATPase superfamily predicted ATPase